MKIQTTFVGGVNPFGTVEEAPAPPPAPVPVPEAPPPAPVRKHRPPSYADYLVDFVYLRPGDPFICQPADVPRVAYAMRKYAKDFGFHVEVRTQRFCPRDNLGRVWMVQKGGKR